jgi:peroxiredoxin Q/BCP
MVNEGDTPPDFTLSGIDGDGNEVEVTLSALTDRPVVLYFYPKDDTSGCTTQACGIRDAWPEFGETGAHVLGISPDGLDSHRKFSDKYDLPFTLLSDPDHEVAEAFGVWKKKKMYGREYWGIERSTFVIANGEVIEAWRRVRAKEHADKVLGMLAELE